MTDLEKHLLREYKKNGIIKVTREYPGCYIIQKGQNYIRVESGENAELADPNEWIANWDFIHHPEEQRDPYIDHFNSLQEAQFEIVQSDNL